MNNELGPSSYRPDTAFHLLPVVLQENKVLNPISDAQHPHPEKTARPLLQATHRPESSCEDLVFSMPSVPAFHSSHDADSSQYTSYQMDFSPPPCPIGLSLWELKSIVT